MDESTVHRIWQDQLFRRSTAIAEDGTPVEVLYPGRWNGEAGPDFLGARIRLGGVERVGDVEIHLARERWTLHGHDRDGAYEGVILHVSLYRNPAPPLRPNVSTFGAAGGEAPLRTRSGRAVPELVLEPLLAEGQRGLEAILASAPPARRCRLEPVAFPGERDVRLRRLAERGRERFEARAARLAAWADALGWDEAFFRAYLETLGYRWNRGAGYEVARRTGWDLLQKRVRPSPASDRADGIEAILLGAAGLIDCGSDRRPNDGRRRLWASLGGGIRPLDRGLWRTSGVRPCNHPARRLRGGARWLAEQPERGPWRVVREAWERSIVKRGASSVKRGSPSSRSGRPGEEGGVSGGDDSERPRSAPDALRSTSDLFVVPHSDGGPALIGADRAGRIWMNAAAPLLLAWFRRRGEEERESRLLDLLATSGRGDDGLTRAFGNRWGVTPGTALEREGVYAAKERGEV